MSVKTTGSDCNVNLKDPDQQCGSEPDGETTIVENGAAIKRSLAKDTSAHSTGANATLSCMLKVQSIQ